MYRIKKNHHDMQKKNKKCLKKKIKKINYQTIQN
jgi:hypothetical protein